MPRRKARQHALRQRLDVGAAPAQRGQGDRIDVEPVSTAGFCAVIEKVTAALVEATGTPIANVRVWIQDVPKENWGIAGVSAKDLGR